LAPGWPDLERNGYPGLMAHMVEHYSY
jgi:hypothetical protein